MKLFFSLLIFVSFNSNAESLWPAEPVVSSMPCIFKIITSYKKSKLNSSIPLPKIKVEGPTTLEEFQIAAQDNMNFLPETFLNLFHEKSNSIFLHAKRKHYINDRTIYDSLAHELVHYIQVKHEGLSAGNDPSDSLESEAIHIQSWFRDNHGHRVVGDNFNCP